jgi:hypothetical protein
LLKADGDVVVITEANTKKSLMVRLTRVCRGQRTWYVWREEARNLGGILPSLLIVGRAYPIEKEDGHYV